jgi:hypothetical protein
MSNLLRKTWYSDSRIFNESLDRWVSGTNPRSEVGQESDWIGWDGWVLVDSSPKVTIKSANPRQGRA